MSNYEESGDNPYEDQDLNDLTEESEEFKPLKNHQFEETHQESDDYEYDFDIKTTTASEERSKQSPIQKKTQTQQKKQPTNPPQEVQPMKKQKVVTQQPSHGSQPQKTSIPQEKPTPRLNPIQQIVISRGKPQVTVVEQELVFTQEDFDFGGNNQQTNIRQTKPMSSQHKPLKKPQQQQQQPQQQQPQSQFKSPQSTLKSPQSTQQPHKQIRTPQKQPPPKPNVGINRIRDVITKYNPTPTQKNLGNKRKTRVENWGGEEGVGELLFESEDEDDEEEDEDESDGMISKVLEEKVLDYLCSQTPNNYIYCFQAKCLTQTPIAKPVVHGGQISSREPIDYNELLMKILNNARENTDIMTSINNQGSPNFITHIIILSFIQHSQFVPISKESDTDK